MTRAGRVAVFLVGGFAGACAGHGDGGGVDSGDAGHATGMPDSGRSTSGEDGPGNTCSGGCITTLASGQRGAEFIAIDAENVYWTMGIESDGIVMKVPKGGGTPTTLASGQLGVQGVAVDATSVYWANGAAEGSICKVSLAGGTPTTLTAAPNGAVGVAVNADSVYFTNLGAKRIPSLSRSMPRARTGRRSGAEPS
jgi:hypothetical protein